MSEGLEKDINNLEQWEDFVTPIDALRMNKITNKIISNSNDINKMSNAMLSLQTKNDSSLETTNKNIPSAINEVNKAVSGKADNNHAHSYNDLINKPVLFSGNYNDLNNKPTIPSKTSELNNDSNFITSIPSEYVNNTELEEALQNVDATSLNGKVFSDPMTKLEYDALPVKDANTIYLVDDDTAIEGVPDYSTGDANKVLAVNSYGNALAWVTAPTGGGGGFTLRDVEDGEIFTIDKEMVYGDIVLSTTSLSVDEGVTGVFTVKLSQAPTEDQTVSISVNNGYCTVDNSSLTFTSSNYSSTQIVTVTGVHNSTDYSDKASVITVTSANVSSKTVNVNIKNIDVEKELSSISAVYTQGSTVVYPTTSLGSLKANLVVTANYSDSSTATITDYALSGALEVGTSTITVAYNSKTTTFNVVVSEAPIIDTSLDAFISEDGYLNIKTELISKIGSTYDRNGDDTTHYYFNLPTNAVPNFATDLSVIGDENYFGDSISYGGRCSLIEFTSGSIDCPDTCYISTGTSVFLRIPMSVYEEYGQNGALALASIIPYFKIPVDEANYETFTITDEIIDAFTARTTWNTGTGEGTCYTGFINGNAEITGIDFNIMDGVCSIGAYTKDSYKGNDYSNWFISANGGRINYRIPYGEISGDSIEELKAYLKEHRLTLYIKRRS